MTWLTRAWTWINTTIRWLAAWLGGREPVFLISMLIVVAATWGLVKITGEVLEGDTQAFDEWMIHALRQPGDSATPIGPKWLHELGRDATAFGGVAALVGFTLVVAGYLLLDGKARMTIFLLIATSGGLILSLGLKQFFARPRPSIVPHLSHVYTSSFPSGHAMLSAVVYLTLGALLAAATPQIRLKIYVLVVASLLSVLVGVSRVYLGVHYPTDVLAGWLAGLVWALLSWHVAHALQRTHQVEPAESGNGDEGA